MCVWGGRSGGGVRGGGRLVASGGGHMLQDPEGRPSGV